VIWKCDVAHKREMATISSKKSADFPLESLLY
ncbi:uncharacterized protein METZ01_LOCUS236375, partial [marine metagenome]